MADWRFELFPQDPTQKKLDEYYPELNVDVNNPISIIKGLIQKNNPSLLEGIQDTLNNPNNPLGAIGTFLNSVNNSLFGESGLFSNPENAWDKFRNGNTNEINKQIADRNFEYGVERDLEGDKRYYDETAYNRALQERIFEREDTALERQASSLSQMGINPLSQSMNGLGSGSVVGASAQGMTTAQNNYQHQGAGLSGLFDIINTLNGISVQNSNRDLMREQSNNQKLINDRQAMENAKFANQNGITKNADGSYSVPDFKHKEQDFSEVDYKDKFSSANRNERVDLTQQSDGTTDSSASIEKILTYLEKTIPEIEVEKNGMNKMFKDLNKFREFITQPLYKWPGELIKNNPWLKDRLYPKKRKNKSFWDLSD